MPFPRVPFDGFSPGDLVYGLTKSRTDYASNYPSFGEADPMRTISTIDQYAMTRNEVDFKRMNNISIPERQEEFLSSIEQHPKYNSILDTRSLPLRYRGEVFYDNAETAIGRKVKAGLHWAKETDIRVHFILDDINMADVLNKTREVEGKVVRPHTGSELRWLYRNRNDPGVQNNVQFWRGGERADPPWESEPERWSNYKPKSVSFSSEKSADLEDEALGAATKAVRVVRRESEAGWATRDIEEFFKLFALFDLF